MNWDKKNIVNICKIVAFGVILYWILNNISMLGTAFGTLCGIFAPFIWGAVIAFIVNIPMTIFEKKVFVRKNDKKKKNIKTKISKGKRLLCILLSFVIIILVIIGVIFLVIPEIIDVIKQTILYLPEVVSNLTNWMNQLIIDYPEIADGLNTWQTNLENISTEVIKELTSAGTNLITSTFSIITTTISGVFKAVLAIIFSIYILIDKEKIWLNLKKITYAFLSKKNADKICEIAKIAKKAFYNFVTGQFMECIILGFLCAVGMFILRLPYSVTVGCLVAITAFIPIVGAFIGGFIGVILLLPISLTKAIIFLVFFVILQQIENNIIYPRVVGSKVGIPGILVLIAITLGGAINGVIGMVIALPATSVLYTLLKGAIDKRLEEKQKKECNEEINNNL